MFSQQPQLNFINDKSMVKKSIFICFTFYKQFTTELIRLKHKIYQGHKKIRANYIFRQHVYPFHTSIIPSIV